MTAETLTTPAHIEPLQAERPQITVIAGGGGGAVVGAGLVEAYPNADVTVVVGVADRGGATEEVRALFGGPAPGDLRNNLAAVSGNNAGGIINYRFASHESLDKLQEKNAEFLLALQGRGHDMQAVASTLDHVAALSKYVVSRRQETLDAEPRDTAVDEEKIAYLNGHTYGNLLLTALRLEHDRDIGKAAEIANEWLETKAKVIPSSIVSHDLLLDDGGTIVVGEGQIDEYVPKHQDKAFVDLEPEDPHSEAEMYGPAYDAVAKADTLIMAPGSVYSTQLALLALDGMDVAIAEQEEHNGKFVLMANIVEDPSAPGVSADAHVGKLYEKTDRAFDLILYNKDTTSLPDKKVPLRVNEASLQGYAEDVIGDSLLSYEKVEHTAGDAVAEKGLRATTHHNIQTAARIMLDKSVVPVEAA